MDNILPTFKSFSVDDDKESQMWSPQTATAYTETPPQYNLRETKVMRNYEREIPAPNARYIRDDGDSESSPLSATERGVAEIPKMNLSQSKHLKYNNIRRDPFKPLINVFNGGILPTQLYYEGVSSVVSVTAFPHSEVARYASGIAPKDKRNLLLFDIHMSTTRRLSVVMSLKQQLRMFQFRPGSIGIEVEMRSNRLTCARIFDGTQASAYRNDLLGAELIAVDGERTVNLSEFEECLGSAHDRCAGGQDFIALTALVNSGAKATIDELIDYNLKSRKVSKLFSNVFNGGEGSSSHHDNNLKEKLARKKKNKLRDLEKKKQSKGSDSSVEDKKNTKPDPPTLLNPIEEVPSKLMAAESISEHYHEDTFGMKADSKKCIIKETADILNSIGSTPQAVVVEVESVISSDESDDDDSLDSSEDPSAGDTRRSAWDYATALDDEDVTSHRRVVCVPDNLALSKGGWGDPSQKYAMNFTNFSRVWTIEISWVGDDAALVSRAILNESDSHIEILSPDHVWCLTAYRKGTNSSQNDTKRDTLDPIEKSMCETDDYGNYAEDVKGYSSVSMLFRPPQIINPTIYTPGLTVLWVPWNSLSFSEYSRRNAEEKNKANTVQQTEESFIFFKIFDFSPALKKSKWDNISSRKK